VPAELAPVVETTLMEVVIVVVEDGKAEKRHYSEADVVIIASPPMAVPAPVTAEPAKSFAAMPAVHLLHQTIIELHCAEVSVG
jgi:hypothetical protein